MMKKATIVSIGLWTARPVRGKSGTRMVDLTRNTRRRSGESVELVAVEDEEGASWCNEMYETRSTFNARIG